MRKVIKILNSNLISFCFLYITLFGGCYRSSTVVINVEEWNNKTLSFFDEECTYFQQKLSLDSFPSTVGTEEGINLMAEYHEQINAWISRRVYLIDQLQKLIDGPIHDLQIFEFHSNSKSIFLIKEMRGDAIGICFDSKGIVTDDKCGSQVVEEYSEVFEMDKKCIIAVELFPEHLQVITKIYHAENGGINYEHKFGWLF